MTSRAWVSALMDPDAEDPALTLITISAAGLTPPLRLVANGSDIVSRGETFSAFPFQFAPPEISDDGSQPARIRIDNVDRRVVETLRGLTSTPRLLVEFVLASAPDAVEESFPPFELGPQSWDAQTIEADLLLPDDMDDGLTRWSFTPTLAPGLFS